ncbi:MAG: AraC family transcriptional regulator [Clostridiales bacterium]|nr:AraC family transcriptional regulator [Clostridiales bacterium]
MLNIEQNINIISSENNEILFNHINNQEDENIHKPHFHDFSELYFFISGDVGYYIEGSYYDLEYGDIIIARPNEIHRPIIRRQCDYERFFIKFPALSFSELSKDIESPIEFIVGDKLSAVRLIRSPDVNKREIADMFYKISSLIQEKQRGWQILAYSYLLKLLTVVGTCASNQICLLTKSALPPLMESVIASINAEFTQTCTAEDIATRYGISNSHLSRLFNRYIGMNFSQYVNAKRISYAKALLSGGASVTDACYECGFSDCSHFISVFKRHVGVTPNKFKHG